MNNLDFVVLMTSDLISKIKTIPSLPGRNEFLMFISEYETC